MACVFDDHSAYAQSIFGLQKGENEEPNLFIGKTEECVLFLEGYNPGKETTPVHRDKKKRKNRVSLKLFIGGSLYFIPLHYLRTSSSKTGRN